MVKGWRKLKILTGTENLWKAGKKLKIHPMITTLEQVWLSKNIGSAHSQGHCLLLPAVGWNKTCISSEDRNSWSEKWFCIMTILFPMQATWLAESWRKCIGQHWNNLPIVQIYLPVIITYLVLWKKHLEGVIQRWHCCWRIYVQLVWEMPLLFL